MFIPARIALSLGLASLSGFAMAADENGTFLDARVNVGIVPGVSSLTYTSSAASGTADLNSKIGIGESLGVEYGQYVSGPWGWVVGANLFDSSNKGDAQNAEGSSVKTNAYGVEVNAGVAYKATKEIHLELTPFVGIGRDKTTDTTDSESGTGTYYDYGIKLAGFYTFNDHWQVGIDVGYLGSKAKATITEGNLSVDGSAKTSGLLAGISLGYRF